MQWRPGERTGAERRGVNGENKKGTSVILSTKDNKNIKRVCNTLKPFLTHDSFTSKYSIKNVINWNIDRSLTTHCLNIICLYKSLDKYIQWDF